MAKINIFTENIYNDWMLDEKFFINNAKKILNSYLNMPEISDRCCL